MEKLDNIAKTPGGGRCYKIKKISAFTLVELIIVITILVVLATIGFLNFGNYGSQARDTVRTVDFKAIQKALELYKIENGEYPEPDNPVEIENTSLNKEKYKGFIEGKIGTELSGKLKFGEVPKDPQTKEEYGYMVTEDRKNYMLKITKEDGGELSVGGIPTSCEKIKELGLFKGNGLYPIFFKERGPIDVYCHKDFNRDFYQFVLGGDMEKDEKTFPLSSNRVFTTEENTTPNGNKSLKLSHREIFPTNHFTYVDPAKSYKLSGNVKIKRNGATGKGWGTLGFIPYDENFKRIWPSYVRVIEGSETELLENTNSGDKTIYFKCDNNLYNLLKNNIYWRIVVAYNVDDTGEYKDLPNRNISWTIGSIQKPEYSDINNIKNNLQKIGNNRCSLKTFHHFPASKKGTKIRFHIDDIHLNYSKREVPFQPEKWIANSLVVTGQAKYLTKTTEQGLFWPGTKFIKVELAGNVWDRFEGNIWKGSDDTSTTYFDDIKMEVID